MLAFYANFGRIGNIPEEKLRALFNPDQWRRVKRFLTQFQAMQPGVEGVEATGPIRIEP
jgi:hypothetical protein